jgi:hypothetical protein
VAIAIKTAILRIVSPWLQGSVDRLDRSPSAQPIGSSEITLVAPSLAAADP